MSLKVLFNTCLTEFGRKIKKIGLKTLHTILQEKIVRSESKKDQCHVRW